MARKNDNGEGLTRREFLESTGKTTLALSAGALGGMSKLVTTAEAATKRGNKEASMPYNILFVLTDQERYFKPENLPSAYSLPGRERLRKEGVSFVNHQIATSVCSSSRSVIYTGQHIQHTKVFDNLGFPWSNELSSDIPTVGSYLEKAGYYPAYLGKCHFIDAFEEIEHGGQAPDANMLNLNAIMQEYGFNDYLGVGDIIGHTLGGYKSDEYTTSAAIRWLRTQTPKLHQEGKPWYLALNLVNPHDVMYYNTDLPGSEAVQNTNIAFPINHEPAHAIYQNKWNMPLPESRHEQWDKPGRPRAHYDYQYARQALVGQFPNEDDRWQRLQDYYLNCIADCDRHIERVLHELDALGLADNTIVVVTSDHGELAGAHGMHGKGATAYREQVNVPLWIRHPEFAASAGSECKAVTSHLDLTPTILGFAGVNSEKRQAMAPNLHGHDINPLLKSPASAPVNAIREGALYNFNMWLYQDADFNQQAVAAKLKGEDVAKLGLKPDLSKRGAIRSVTDGRYRFSRYYSPKQHNLPKSIEEIFKYNDVELYDLEADPNEINNLASDRKTNGDLILAMNKKLTDIIGSEVGSDEGEFLPENKAGWVIDRLDP